MMMLRLTEVEKTLYTDAAARQRKKLSAWLRDAANTYLLSQGRPHDASRDLRP